MPDKRQRSSQFDIDPVTDKPREPAIDTDPKTGGRFDREQFRGTGITPEEIVDEKPIVDPFPSTTEVHTDEDTGTKEVKWGETVVGVIADDSDIVETTIGEDGVEGGGALTQEEMQQQQQEREASKREKRDEKDWVSVEDAEPKQTHQTRARKQE